MEKIGLVNELKDADILNNYDKSAEILYFIRSKILSIRADVEKILSITKEKITFDELLNCFDREAKNKML